MASAAVFLATSRSPITCPWPSSQALSIYTHRHFTIMYKAERKDLFYGAVL